MIRIFFLPKLFFHLISIGDGISFEKNSGSNFSVHPKGPKSKMAAKMAAVTWYFNISAPIHCRTKILSTIYMYFNSIETMELKLKCYKQKISTWYWNVIKFVLFCFKISVPAIVTKCSYKILPISTNHNNLSTDLGW